MCNHEILINRITLYNRQDNHKSSIWIAGYLYLSNQMTIVIVNCTISAFIAMTRLFVMLKGYKITENFFTRPHSSLTNILLPSPDLPFITIVHVTDLWRHRAAHLHIFGESDWPCLSPRKHEQQQQQADREMATSSVSTMQTTTYSTTDNYSSSYRISTHTHTWSQTLSHTTGQTGHNKVSIH